MAKYSIKDLEKVSGIKAHTIRIWEQRYNLIVPERSETNIRSYSDADLKKILNVSILNRNGWKISKITQLNSEEIKDKLLHLSQDPDDLDTKMESLIMAMLDLDENLFNKVINDLIISKGFDYVFTVVIKNLMKKAGVLWITGTISPGQEHFISNLVRQKLLSLINSIKFVESPEAQKYILFLPEGEWHELSLLYLSYLLKKAGHHYLYLGQCTPLESAKKANDKWQADKIVISLTTAFSKGSTDSYLSELLEQFPKQQILFNTNANFKIDETKFKEFTFIRDYSEFKEHI